MKAESNIAPAAPYELEFNREEVDIIFYDNVRETAAEDGTHYTYDIYRMTVKYRPTLIDDLESNSMAWLKAAKDSEYKRLADSVRAKRNELLAATDWTQVPDAPLTVEQKADMQVYRQALRDTPEQDGFPYDVNWPVMPEKK